MSRHIIKLEYDDGVKLNKPVLWCGIKSNAYTWYFTDLHHAVLSIENGSTIQPCKRCLKSASKLITRSINE